MSEGECKACAGRHRAHICGKVKRAATLQESTAVRKPVKTIVKQWPPAVDSTATAGGIATRAPPTDRTAAREAQEAAKRASSPSNGTLQRLLTANCEAANTDRNSVMGTCDDKTVLAAEAQTAPPPIARVGEGVCGVCVGPRGDGRTLGRAAAWWTGRGGSESRGSRPSSNPKGRAGFLFTPLPPSTASLRLLASAPTAFN